MIVVLIVIAVPLQAMAERRRLVRDLEAGVGSARLVAYRRIMVWEWGMAATLVVVWLVAGRSFTLLGFAPPAGGRFAIALAIALALTGLLGAQLRAAKRPQVAEQIRAAAASMSYLLPATHRELRRFTWLGITAGIVEELIYRGYLMWYATSFGPTWMALLLSSLVFGIGHAYQGAAGIAKTGTVGLVLGALYWLSGSLWVPMLVHAMVDVLNGKMVYVATPRGAE